MQTKYCAWLVFLLAFHLIKKIKTGFEKKEKNPATNLDLIRGLCGIRMTLGGSLFSWRREESSKCKVIPLG